MPFFPRAWILAAWILAAWMAPAAFSDPAGARVDMAVFSDRQSFWPGLAGHAKPAVKAPPASHKARGGEAPSVRLAILPITLKDYKESLPCDSCHRLSANGMEFFLENWLKDRLHDRFPAWSVELVAPSQPLLEGKMDLLRYQDSLAFPWEGWFPDSAESLVYRPKDRFTAAGTRKRMDKLGGLLGASHLILPCRMRVSVTPKSSITHEGGLDWGFSLVLWNVAAGAPEWALDYRSRETGMNLDESLEGRLDKALGGAWNDLPRGLTSLWDAEPR
jgi:hypothetical protein